MSEENKTVTAMRNFGKAAENAMLALKPFVEAVSKAMGEWDRILYAQYLKNGAIYGETREGYYRWCDEVIGAFKEERRAKRRLEIHGY